MNDHVRLESDVIDGQCRMVYKKMAINLQMMVNLPKSNKQPVPTIFIEWEIM